MSDGDSGSMSGDDPATTPVQSWTKSPVGLAAAALCAASAVCLSLHLVLRHLQLFRVPESQRSVIRILLIVPLYAICSFVSLCAEETGDYISQMRDIYEAWVIYLFLRLVIDFAGGDSVCATDMHQRGPIRHPRPLCCLAPLHPGAMFLRRCKQFTLQFAVVKPVCALLSTIMLIAGQYEHPVYQWILFVVYNVSYTLALGALGYLYLAVWKSIKDRNPVFKFLSIKLVVFLTYWQALAVDRLPLEKAELKRVNNYLLVVEMLLFAFVHRRAFPVSEFSSEEAVGGAAQAGASGKYVGLSMAGKIKTVLSVADVMEDAKDNFSAHGAAPIEGYRGASLLNSDEHITSRAGPDYSAEAVSL